MDRERVRSRRMLPRVLGAAAVFTTSIVAVGGAALPASAAPVD